MWCPGAGRGFQKACGAGSAGGVAVCCPQPAPAFAGPPPSAHPFGRSLSRSFGHHDTAFDPGMNQERFLDGP